MLSDVTTRISCGAASASTSRTISSSAEFAAALGACAISITEEVKGVDGGRSIRSHTCGYPRRLKGSPKERAVDDCSTDYPYASAEAKNWLICEAISS